jgi:hypothetical protein
MEIYKLVIDLEDETGLTFNALVDRPAHNKALLAFGKKKAPTKMFFNEEKRMVTGVAISANQLIYRNDPEMGEYYVFFEPKEIEKMVLKMSRQQLLSSVNLMHDAKNVVNGITFVEGYFVTDTKRPSNDSQNIQNGSYVMTYFVEDDNLWNELKDGRYLGYSVEGLFDQVPIEYKKKQTINNNKNQKMKKKSLFSVVFGKTEKFAEVTTADGVVLSYEGELAAGTAVFILDAEGAQMTAPEGNYLLDDGRTVVVDADGMVAEVQEVATEEVPEDVELAEVINVMKELATNHEALKAEFEAFKKAQVPAGEQKFKRKEGAPTWKELIKK